MKTTRQQIIGAVAVLLASAVCTSAIEGLKVAVRCPDVILSWPSAEGKTYIVQYRPDLSTNSTWITLTNSLPAAIGTNVTVFVDSNRVNCGSGGGGGAGGGGSAPPPLNSASALTAATSISLITADATPLPRWVLEGRPPYPWELEDRPPYPWEAGAIKQTSSLSTTAIGTPLSLQGADDPQPQDDNGGGGGGGDDPGSYQVVQDGVHIVGLTNLTNATLSGTVTVQIEAGNADPASTNLLGALSSGALILDGEKFAGGAALGSPWDGNPWQFAMDTAFLENGTHTVQVEVSWKNPDSSDNVRQYFDRWSDPITITVSNRIYYPDWEPEIGEMGISAYFLKTTCTDADWHIDIYDSGSNFVQTLSGHTMDGTIEAYWNMVDTNGVTRTNAGLDPRFDSIVTVADPATKQTPRKNQRPQSWPDHGKWAIAYQDYFKFEYSQNNAQQGSINAFANTSAKFGGYYLWYPQPGQTNDIGQTYPMRYQKTNHLDTNITAAAIFLDQQMLRQFLSRTNSRNFYYDGHGDADNIAGIASFLLDATVQHRYRFVFLNACNSANGDLDKAFGINGPKRFDVGYYHRTGIRPAAFLGYTTTVYYNDAVPIRVNGVDYDDTIPWQVPGFITNLLFYWDTDTIGYGLLSAIDNAASGLPPVYGQYREDYLAIHGFFNLHIDEVNHKWNTW